MTVNRTTLLDLPLPVTGTESGTWGDTTNNGLTQYVDIAIAGMSNLTSANFTAGALTIETTEGDSSATNISATSAQYAGFRVSSLAVNSTITVGNTGTSPARSYRLINADATYSLTFKATGQTGVTLLPGQSAVVAFNGTDYVIIGVVGAGSTTDNTVPRFDGTTGEILQSSGVTIDDSNNVSGVAQLNITTLDATNIEVTNIKAKDGTAAASIADSTGVISVTANPVLSGGTANGVLYLNGSKVATSGSALTFDGTGMTIGAAASASTRLTVNGPVQFNASTDTNTYIGLQNTAYLTAGGSIVFGANSAEAMRLTSTGLGIGTSSPGDKLQVGSGNSSVKIGANGANNFQIYNGALTQDGTNYAFAQNYTGQNTQVNAATGGQILLQIASNTKATLDSSGNLGLGVTPSAWDSVSVWKSLQVRSAALSATTTYAVMSYNGYENLGWKYIGSGAATAYTQSAGSHIWNIAPSGTAGNAITFTQAMTLDASGRLAIGATSVTNGTAYGGGGQVNVAKIESAGYPCFQINTNTNGGGSLQFTNSNTVNGVVGYNVSGGTNELAIINSLSGAVTFATNNTERARITSGGNLLVGTTADYLASQVLVKTTTTDNSTNALTLQNSAATELLRVRSDGYTYAGFYAQTTGSAANVFIGSGGDLLRSTSSLKYKTDVQNATHGLAEVMQLRPVTYKGKNDGDTVFGGLVAEEVHALGLTEFVQYAPDGSPDALAYGNMVSLLTKAIQEQQALITSLTARVALLEGN